MKKLILIFVACFLATQLMAYEKLSLVERFTNASCVPCAQINNAWYNETTHALINSGSISHIVYNGWWPGSNDPMYILNQADNTVRINYYNVNAVPTIAISGTVISTSEAGLTNAVNSDNSQYSPFFITIIQEELSQSLIKYTVKILRDINDNTTFSNVKLRFALTEKTVVFPCPPGSNGESEFYSVCRKMLPNAAGTSLPIPEPGEFSEIVLEYVPTSQFLAAVNLDSIRAVAFIQSDDTKYVYQSFMAKNNSASIYASSSDLLVDNTSEGEFSTTVFNTGLLDDSYEVQVTHDGPAGWLGEFTTTNGTFSFGQTDIIDVAAGDTANISVSLNPIGLNGFGKISVQFSSLADPTIFTASTMRLVTLTGVNGLVIDASNEGFGDLVLAPLDQEFTYPYGIVSRDAIFPSIDLTNFKLIVWSSGNNYPVFKQDEIDALEPFLDNNGLLLINGQNIGEDIFDPDGQSQFAQSFYNNYLHADYLANWGQSYFMTGIDGDPITNQISFPLADVYPKSPDQISAYDAHATPVLKFGVTQNYNSLKADDGNSKVVYFGVGFEQISDQLLRDTVIVRSIRWLMDGVVLSTPNDDLLATTYNLDQNYPNPFNPSTTISYSISNESQVSLKVYDVMGKEIANLIDEKQSSGNYSIEFDASSMASGTYFYKLITGEFISVKKMVLLK